jgi:predicted unusual protein kinase regulating ubiquinone biosynthesis (AarF/ABC1/UbiB family)
LFDFGATHIYNPQFLESYYQIIRGAVNEDQELIWQGSIQTGFVTNE